MADLENSNELEELEEMFKDRFTEKDVEFMKIKNKKTLPPPVVIPWNIRRDWFKKYDYSSRHEQRRPRDNDQRHRNEGSSRYRDRSNDGEGSRHRDRYNDNKRSRYNREDRRSRERD